jgi:4-hydroxybenzoate polyprenyltransferase
MLLFIVGILVVLWLLGVLAHIAGGLIYILLVIALIVFIYDTLSKHSKT